MSATRTMNWNNLVQYSKSTKIPLNPINDRQRKKVRIVERMLKRYMQFNSHNILSVGRRWGKATRIHRIITHYTSLYELKFALESNDRQRIKAEINRRINYRAQKYDSCYR